MLSSPSVLIDLKFICLSVVCGIPIFSAISSFSCCFVEISLGCENSNSKKSAKSSSAWSSIFGLLLRQFTSFYMLRCSKRRTMFFVLIVVEHL